MASTYSPLLRVELIGTGDQSGTWGLTTNENLGTILEDAIAGTATIDVTVSNVTLTNVDGAADEARCMILKVIGTPGTSRNIVAPSTSKVYVVINDSNNSIVLKGSATTGLTILSGDRLVAAFNGTDFVSIVPSLPSTVVTLNGVQTLTDKTLTSPRIGTSFLDTNGNELLKVTATASAVNELALSNSATGTSPLLSATGDDTNIDVSFVPKGSGVVRSSTTFNDLHGKLRAVPVSGLAKTAPYTLTVNDVGLMIEVQSGGNITIPNATFTAGDAVSIFNNSSGSITITCSITTAYVAGVNEDKASVTLINRGVATVFFSSGTECVISGNVS
jgi:hypothetical protein